MLIMAAVIKKPAELLFLSQQSPVNIFNNTERNVQAKITDRSSWSVSNLPSGTRSTSPVLFSLNLIVSNDISNTRWLFYRASVEFWCWGSKLLLFWWLCKPGAEVTPIVVLARTNICASSSCDNCFILMYSCTLKSFPRVMWRQEMP